MEKNLFKADVQYRLAVVDRTQKELAERLNITEAYLSTLLKCVNDTPVAELWREKIIEVLKKFEEESRCVVDGPKK